MAVTINKEMLEVVAAALGPLKTEVVFVGGAILPLYITDMTNITEVRQTDDVDCIIKIKSRLNYVALEEKLRTLGFENDQRVICRWHCKGIIVDIMPTSPEILGFANRWYEEVIVNSISFTLDNGQIINIAALPWFMACKLEALFDRGLKDLRLSKDMEDIVFLIHYVTNLNQQINQSPEHLQAYIRQKFLALSQMPDIGEAIFCVLPYGDNDPNTIKSIRAEIQRFAVS